MHAFECSICSLVVSLQFPLAKSINLYNLNRIQINSLQYPTNIIVFLA